MEKRGFTPHLASGVKEAAAIAHTNPPAFAVVDLRLEDGDGLEVVQKIHATREDCRVVILTGYGNIATAVAAVKAGALDYLPKPADANDIEKALLAPPGERPPPPETQCLRTACGGSISNAYMSYADIMFLKPRAVLACTGEHCSAFWQNAPRVRAANGCAIVILC